jgi:hypothetical protein
VSIRHCYPFTHNGLQGFSRGSTDTAAVSTASGSAGSTDIITYPSTSLSATASDAAATDSNPMMQTITSEFPFLTQSTLVFTSISSSPAATITDPDQPTTTVSLDTSATALPPQAPLPSGMPARIYPVNGTDPSTADIPGSTFISLLFNQELNWQFVTQNPVSSSQIFAYLPVVLTTALNITGKFPQVK